METKKDYVIAYESGNIEQFKGTHNEAFAYAKEKADHFKLYAKEDYEKEFGGLDSASTKERINHQRLKEKMESAGEPKVKKKPNDKGK